MKDFFRKYKMIKTVALSLLLSVLLAGCGTIPGKADGAVQAPGTGGSSGDSLSQNTGGASEDAVEKTEVHYIDVGQGDATLICSDGRYMLIDAGSDEQSTKLQLYLCKEGVDRLDYLVLTHPDSDHIGGADVLLMKYDVGMILTTDYKKQGSSSEKLNEVMEEKGLVYTVPKVGETYALGSAGFTILAPNASYEDANNSSVALLFEDGENSFLFTGDCETQAEADILKNGLDIDCDVYKLGHHGSSDASTPEFLRAITPEVGIVSCGENDYGHPHKEPLAALQAMDVTVYRTDTDGSIVAVSEESGITWEFDKEKLSTDNYIIANRNSKVVHQGTCDGLPAEGNRVIFGTVGEAQEAGFTKFCNGCMEKKR